MTPLLCLQPPHPKDIIPRRGLITGAKVVNYFELSKSNVNKNAIYANFAEMARVYNAILNMSGNGIVAN